MTAGDSQSLTPPHSKGLPAGTRGGQRREEPRSRGGTRHGSAGQGGGRRSSGGQEAEEAAENLQRSFFLRPAGSIRASDRGAGGAGGAGEGGDARGEEQEEGGEEEEEEEKVQEVQEERGEGAALQLALPVARTTEHGLHLLDAALIRVHRGEPRRRQQSMMGGGLSGPWSGRQTCRVCSLVK